MQRVLCQSLGTFDFNNASTICIPVTINVLDGALFNNQWVDPIIQGLNKNFSSAKISFELKAIDSFSFFEFDDFNMLNPERADQMRYDNDSFNIYVADFLGKTILCVDALTGMANGGKF